MDGLTLDFVKEKFFINGNFVTCLITVNIKTYNPYDLKTFVARGTAEARNEPFDLEKGKLLAKTRAEIELNRKYQEIINGEIKHHKECLKQLEIKYNKVQKYVLGRKNFEKKF